MSDAAIGRPGPQVVDGERLAAILARLDVVPDELLRALADLIRSGRDEDVVRINPVRFAELHGFEPDAVVSLFLHARKHGLLAMEWQVVCPGCGEIVEHLTSLTSASAHVFCRTCSTDRDTDLSDFVEIGFTVSPEIRLSRYHDPWSLTPEEHFLSYRFAQSAFVEDGSPLRDHLRRCGIAQVYVDPGVTYRFALTAQPGYLWFTSGPALIVGEELTPETRAFEFEYTGVRGEGFRAQIAAGPVEIAFTNATDERYAVAITWLTDQYELTMGPFLSGAEVLSNQTFLDLFADETIVAPEGLAVRRLGLLFTDLTSSTALYEQVGDMKAFDLVRQHFGLLRACIQRNSGALVKTIGDAVMASFVDPLDGLRAALEMRTEIVRFNADAGDDLIGLKVGLHTGACLAVTLNDRLDYFGQTVNVAARVQGLAKANEIVVTDDVYSLPGAEEILAGLDTKVDGVQLKGIAGVVLIHRILG